jgi:hypothetical protein
MIIVYPHYFSGAEAPGFGVRAMKSQGMLMDTSGLDCDAPDGPFICVKCGHKL